MLSKINPMHQAELEMVNEFLSGLQTVEEVIKNRVSGELKTQDIAINLSPLLNDSLFCVIDKQNNNQMLVQDFLELFVSRWHQEIQYQQDIFNLKDQIINEFNKLCNQAKNKNFIEDIRKHSQEIVETLFAKANFDKKHLAGNFCKSFMNGFENEMIKKIEYYAIYVVWMPFTTFLPKGLIELVKKTIHEKIEKTLTKEKIVSASASIKLYIEDQFKEKEIKIQGKISANSSSGKIKKTIGINQLATILKEAQISKTVCALVIDEVGKDSNVISCERKNIQTIIIKMSANQFLQASISFTYEYLELKDLEDEKDFEQVIQIIQRLPKCLKNANLQFKSNKQNGIMIINKEQEQKHMYELSFTQNKISYNQMKFLGRLRNVIHFPLFFIISNFQYHSGSSGTDEEIITLSNVFSHSKSFQHLHLDFNEASITISAIDCLAASISNMKQMKYLNLNFSHGTNSSNNNSMALYAQAISEMIILCHLELNFSGGNNEMTDEGIMQLGQAIAKSTCIQKLILYFRSNGGNAVTDKGIESLSQSIAHHKNIQQLELVFGDGNHQINDKGMQALATALKNTNKILELCLDFHGGKNSITDASMDFLADALKQMPSELSIEFWFQSNNTPKVTAKGELCIRNARTYRSITFWHDG